MRTKRLVEQQLVRLSREEKAQLTESAELLGINATELARLALRIGIPRLLRDLTVHATREVRAE